MNILIKSRYLPHSSDYKKRSSSWFKMNIFIHCWVALIECLRYCFTVLLLYILILLVSINHITYIIYMSVTLYLHIFTNINIYIYALYLDLCSFGVDLVHYHTSRISFSMDKGAEIVWLEKVIQKLHWEYTKFCW